MRFKLDSLSNKNDSWSFDGVCEKCGENKSECKCVSAEIMPKDKHRLHFRLEKRNGKPVTVVLPFALSEDDMKKLLSILKKKLACGGAINKNEIELQGDLKERVKEILIKEGFKFK